MSAYRSGNLVDARRSFEILAAGNAKANRLVHAGAYWAARLNLMTSRPDKVRLYLNIASEASDGFYGILALAALGEEREFEDDMPNLSTFERDELTTMPEVQRAVALEKLDCAPTGWFEYGDCFPRQVPEFGPPVKNAEAWVMSPAETNGAEVVLLTSLPLCIDKPRLKPVQWPRVLI